MTKSERAQVVDLLRCAADLRVGNRGGLTSIGHDTPDEWATAADKWTADVWIETDGNEWRATGPGHDDGSHDHGSEPGCPDEQAAQRDAAFIVLARSALPAAIEEIEKLRAIIARVAAASNGYWNGARLGEDYDRAEVALHEIANAIGEPF